MKRLKYLALASLVAFAACDEDGPVDPVVQTGGVQVTVTANGTGIQGVQVALAGAASQSGTTGANGQATFSNVPAGNYAVTISGQGADYACATTSQPVTVAGGQTANVAFTCNIVQTASISGAVTRGTDPLPGSTITITRVNPAPAGAPQTLQTGVNGQYSLTGLRSGTYRVVLTQPTGVACSVNTQEVNLVAGQAQIVNFSCLAAPPPPPPPAAVPVVTIQSITVPGPFAGTTVPANPDSLRGRVDVTVNIDPRGNNLLEYRLMARNAAGTVYEICRQTFGSGSDIAQQTTVQDITCSWNTDRIRERDGTSAVRIATSVTGTFAPIGPGNDATSPNRPHHPVFLNGAYEIIARVVPATVAAVTATRTGTTTNMDAVALGVTADNRNWNNPNGGAPFPSTLIHTTTGLRWLSGDVHVTAYPIIYSAPYDPNNPLIDRAAFMFDGFVAGADVARGGTQLTTPAANGTFRFSFCEAAAPATATDGSTCYARINGMNTGDVGARNLALQTVTRFGQFGPTLANLKTIYLFDQDLQSGTRGTLNDVLRIDNEGPTSPTLALREHPITGFSRWGGSPGSAGWVNWAYSFTATGGYTLPTSDNPFTYPALDKNGSGVGTWCDPAGDLCRATGTAILGIGVNTTGTTRQIYHVGPDATAGLAVGAVVPGLGINTNLITTGADLTPETDSPGLLDAGSATGTPFSDTENDYALAGRSWDLFGNATNSNVIYIGVDGKAPVFGTNSVIDPTIAGSVYNTYGAINAYGAGKVPGQYMGNTTDTGNGFSGVAGIQINDREWGCPAGAFSCVGAAGVGSTTRWGYKIQPTAGGSTLAWVFDALVAGAMQNNIWGTDNAPGGAGTNTSTTATAADLIAYDAPFAPPQPVPANDGYRRELTTSWDRAGNSSATPLVTEHIADKARPVVGNVQMPTIPTFLLGSQQTFNGRVQDAVDLKKSDFAFDFQSIQSLQTWLEPLPAEGMPLDKDGRAFVATSLQLPLHNIAHTAFGSASILHDIDLAATVPFLTCLVRFDEMGGATQASGATAEPTIHRPRGPRFRTWDHASEYGLTNTQHNTFTPTSIPDCPTRASILGSSLSPSASTAGAWVFTTDVNGRPVLTLSGTTSTFVPSVDISQVALYYLDAQGRAILLNTGSPNWSLVVTDTGSGSLGRSYAWTFNGTLPGVGQITTSAGAPTGYFFVLQRTGALAGTGLIWDATSNP